MWRPPVPMYSIEWLKRGLPHVHILIWLEEKLLRNQIDSIISAEIPDPRNQNMIHGPSGTRNPVSPCMKNGKCTKKYPREMIRETVHNDKGYPLYRRRAPEDGGKIVDIQTRSGVIKSFDNS
ncbi:hypothetical protein EVAR_65470_1 [Eumeta japonica]|uniref:Helitron helicase-like domain-containing protein n=1 Tax=Eumeta variegata TaxID=151549 RepID=A0A4C1YR60_EUMVA|nr:hypothetical protein EVAR_65470_1 [Eumeta japonica]